ncbi:MAG TPA: hypothetical protein VH092_22805 [Urbifossiella sp.]|jgi:hypothetical protein|nr:hypothetical protein [Urbifossiella sp.]
MNRTPLPPDALDAALAGYFRNELPRPWPAAPAVASPARAARPDPGRRARVTLAASVAALAGACWLLASGSGPSVAPAAKTAPGPDVLQNATARTPADADKAKAKAAAATDPMNGFQPGALPLP